MTYNDWIMRCFQGVIGVAEALYCSLRNKSTIKCGMLHDLLDRLSIHISHNHWSLHQSSI